MLAAVLSVACAAMFAAPPCADTAWGEAGCGLAVAVAQGCCESPSADGTCPEEGGNCSCSQVPGLTSTHFLQPDTVLSALALVACPSLSSVLGGPPPHVPIP